MTAANGSRAEELKRKLALACRILGTEGHDDLNLGHISARGGDGETIFMKGSGLGLREIYEKDMVEIGLDYRKRSGERKPHDELPIHIEIYRSRPDVACVIHTHPVYATAFSGSGRRVPAVNNEAAFFALHTVYFDLTTDLIVTPEQGRSLAEKLAGNKEIFLKNHGIVVAGSSIEEATVRAFLLEKALKAVFVATVFGAAAGADDGEIRQKEARMFTEAKVRARWEALVRRLEERELPVRILKALESKRLL